MQLNMHFLNDVLCVFLAALGPAGCMGVSLVAALGAAV